MFINAVIFKKLEHVYNQLPGKDQHHYLTFSPLSTGFTNYDFNFLNTRLSAEEISGSIENKLAFACFANAIVRNQKVYDLNTADFLQDSYKKILDNAILIESSLSEEDKEAYRQAKQLLFINENLDPTAEYSKYQGYRDRCDLITRQLAELEDQLLRESGNSEAAAKQQALRGKLSVVINDWLIEGNKEKIEKAEKTVFSVNPRSAFVTLWRTESLSVKSLPPVSTVNSDMEFAPVFCLPDSLYDYNYHGWKRVVLEEAEIQALTGESKSYLGDGLYGEFDDGNNSVTKIEFEYIFVSLLRNWFKPDLINSNFWCFPADSTDIVSDETDPARGLMPAYIDKFIFIRRISAFGSEKKTGGEDSIPGSGNKVIRFKDVARIKQVREIGKVDPVVTTTSKFRILSAENLVLKPVLMKQPASKRMTMTPFTKRTVAARRFADIRNLVRPHHIGPIAPDTAFNLTLIFTDNLKNPVDGINVVLTNKTDGSVYSRETGDDGKTIFPELPKNEYSVAIRDEELFEDYDVTLMIDKEIVRTIVLTRRANPRFDMFLIGAINYRFPKLPNPLTGFTYG